MQPQSNIIQSVINSMGQVLGKPDELILLHRPYLPPNAWQYVKECLDTGWISSAGAYVTKFEEKLAELTGAARAVAVVNGTAALQVCFYLAGVRSGDEVLVPSLSFVATANATTHAGATPHFIDVCPQRLGMSADALADRLQAIAVRRDGAWYNRDTGARLAAICPMHCFGHPCDLDALLAISQRYDLPLIEDTAESLGSYYKQKHTGRFGKLAAISFNGNKILTTGGGGAILTDDHALADSAKHLTTTAKVPHAWEFHHDQIGWNFRMPNINAALGYAQLECLPMLLKAKRRLYQAYASAVSDLPGVSLLQEPADSQSNYWLNCIMVQGGLSVRDELLAQLNRAGYQCRPLWQPMHQLPIYASCPRGTMEHTERCYQQAINIPSSADLAPDWLNEQVMQ